MDPSKEKLNDALALKNDAQQMSLRLRLDALVTRFAAGNMQAMLDFDHLANDGLTDSKGNLLSQMGRFSLLNRDQDAQSPQP